MTHQKEIHLRIFYSSHETFQCSIGQRAMKKLYSIAIPKITNSSPKPKRMTSHLNQNSLKKLDNLPVLIWSVWGFEREASFFLILVVHQLTFKTARKSLWKFDTSRVPSTSKIRPSQGFCKGLILYNTAKSRTILSYFILLTLYKWLVINTILIFNLRVSATRVFE